MRDKVILEFGENLWFIVHIVGVDLEEPQNVREAMTTVNR